MPLSVKSTTTSWCFIPLPPLTGPRSLTRQKWPSLIRANRHFFEHASNILFAWSEVLHQPKRCCSSMRVSLLFASRLLLSENGGTYLHFGTQVIRFSITDCPVSDIQELPKPQFQGVRQPRCPICAALPRLTHTMLDVRSGKTVRLYQCRCGERVWED
jgi:hypothetical protein